MRYIFLDTVSSTNEYAMKTLAKSDPPENICLYTYNQSAGRGQIGRKWFGDTDKNIACSYVVHPHNLLAKNQFYLNQAFSLAVHDLISSYVDKPVRIKWPNDIYVEDKKIAGILIQNVLRAESISSSILGVGINVNTTDFPPNIPNPTSLAIVSGKSFELHPLVYKLSDLVEHRLQQLTLNKESLAKAYDALLYRKDVEHSFTIDNESQKGIIRGVLPDGKLELEMHGKRHYFGFREIRFNIPHGQMG